MERLTAPKETTGDIRNTEAYRTQVRPEQESHLRHMTPAERHSAIREGAVVVGFSGLISLLIDMHRQSQAKNRRPAGMHWSPYSHGWVFR